MTRNISVQEAIQTPIEKQETEIVERKGIGHPDSLADGLSEAVSRALCQLYIGKFGRILHHNTDETQIVGGQSAPKFGGGAVLEPAYILLVGRATTEVNGERLPYRAHAIKAARGYIAKICPHLDVDMDVTFDCRIGKGSVDLTGLYETQKLLANDTSFGVSFAPFSETETLALEVEHFINGPLKADLPEVGQDVKVMAVRIGNRIGLTIAAAMVDRFIDDKDHYVSAIEELVDRTSDYASKFTSREVRVEANTGDNYSTGIFYLTVTGLSMENGDDGSVGRGNRANGLITPYRPMSLEATAGKNPVTHVGKIYNLLAFQLAHRIVKETGGDVLEAHVRIVSQIGKPVDQPQAASIQLILAPNVPLNRHKTLVEGIVEEGLVNTPRITDQVVRGELSVF